MKTAKYEIDYVEQGPRYDGRPYWRVIDRHGQLVNFYDTLPDARKDYPKARLVGRFAV